MPQGIKRVASADWRTENLEELWSRTSALDLDPLYRSLHDFLEYCCLLRRVRQQFEMDSHAIGFDGHAFFLRGGYFAFKYLNVTSSLALRATILGGLNHARHPREELRRFIKELQDKALSAGKTYVDLLIVDEVKSGTGMGTILNLVEESMSCWPASARCGINVCFYAIRPVDQMTDQFQAAEIRWRGKHETNGGLLVIDIKHFAGPLPGYDNEMFCGVKILSRSTDETEAYSILKFSRGTVAFRCDSTKKFVFNDILDNSCLVESLSYYAVAWTCHPESIVSKTLTQQIKLLGCSSCSELYRKAADQP